MKRFSLVITMALLFVAGTITAQQQQRTGQRGQFSTTARAEREVEQLKSSLSLTEQQAKDVFKICLKYAQQDSVRMAEMRSSGQEFDREAFMKQREEVTKTKTAELNKVFTPQQQKDYAKQLEEAAQRRMQRQGAAPGQGGNR
ncbi:MAG: hypothetical protein ACOX59_05705 [Bacteroidales bacterium]|jgi:hypothetical protein|nr:hypothetical protein [Bacteroidales bacterium]MDI9545144.1 hypothetical protein [Bacteroidota bacterium]OQC03857.1 MAG: hypothetical protein BWX77_00461 [Bacteroidetes bacterium ADurb.Bin090]MBP8981810.1 hypothetical protein [Bacteroidales bacterium]HNZ81114.1 hypothetical protein [Bacteroidales bacterium]